MNMILMQTSEGSSTVHLNDWQSFIWIVLGVILSVTVPIAVKVLKPKVELQGTSSSRSFKWAEPYIKTGAASVVVGFLTLITVRYTGGNFTDWTQALMTGYLWDSTLQKVRDGLR